MDTEFFRQKRSYLTELITVLSTSTPLTVASLNNVQTGNASNKEYDCAPYGGKASAVIIECKTEGIYYTLDGSTPTSDDRTLNPGDTLPIAGYGKASKFRAIRQTGTNATIAVEYFKD